MRSRIGVITAQFLVSGRVVGAGVGLTNAAAMVGNLVDVNAGRPSSLLRRSPNGRRTTTLATLNSLATMLARCATSVRPCARLASLTTPAGKPRPATPLQSFANIAKSPARNASTLFRLVGRSRLYSPTLTRAPSSWILAIKFVGNGRQLSGPGNIAFDARGDIWITNNYRVAARPAQVCAGTTLLRLRPYSKNATVDSFAGGGINGAGFGIGIDPSGQIWVGNFGFKGSRCTKTPPSNSISRFSSRGVARSGPAGYSVGGISWPQGTVPDRQGTIWVANCGNNTVTRYPSGNPALHTESGARWASRSTSSSIATEPPG